MNAIMNAVRLDFWLSKMDEGMNIIISQQIQAT